MNAKMFTLVVSVSLLAACAGPVTEERDTKRSGRELGTVLCEELGEQACLTTLGCELVYPACPACAEGPDCPPCDAAPRCQQSTPQEPPPAPDSCEGLDEATCSSRSDCYADYGACTAVCEDDGKGGCKPCESPYLGCRDAYAPPPSACDGLGERACNRTSGCIGVYARECPPCAPDMACDACSDVSEVFSYCTHDVEVCGGGTGGSGSVDAGSPTYGGGSREP